MSDRENLLFNLLLQNYKNSHLLFLRLKVNLNFALISTGYHRLREGVPVSNKTRAITNIAFILTMTSNVTQIAGEKMVLA